MFQFHHHFLSFRREVTHLAVRASLVGTFLSILFVKAGGGHNIAIAQMVLGAFIASIIEAGSITFNVKHRLIAMITGSLMCGVATFLGSVIGDNFIYFSIALLIFMFIVGIASSESDLTSLIILFTVDVFMINAGLASSSKVALIYGVAFTLGGFSLVLLSYIHNLFYFTKYTTKDHLDYNQRPLLNLSKQSVFFAIRLTLAVSLANLVAYHFKLPQWYWAPLTASLILKISHDQSWQRISHRFFGTIWGCLLSLIVLSFIQNKLLLCFMILPIWFFVVITFVRHYGAFVFFLTAFVTILFNLLSNFGVEVVEERVFETIVGTVSVILVILIFMPFIKKNENATPHHIHKT